MKRIVPVAIAVIYDEKNRTFLLTQRREIDREDQKYGHCWNFPGGGIQWGEDPIAALRREIKEELDAEVEVKGLLPRIFSPVRGQWNGLLICYLCTLVNPHQIITLNHESLAYGWFTLEEIKKLTLLPHGLEIAILASTLL